MMNAQLNTDGIRIVWAKVPNFPWWPGEIIEESDTENPRPPQSGHVVSFFAEDTIQRVPVKNIKPYGEFKNKYNALGEKKLRTAADRVMFRRAIGLADMEVENQLKDSRQKKYTKRLVLNPKRWKKYTQKLTSQDDFRTSCFVTPDPKSSDLGIGQLDSGVPFSSECLEEPFSSECLEEPFDQSSQLTEVSSNKTVFHPSSSPKSALSADLDDGDDMPSLEDVMKEPPFDPQPGDIIWMKYRKFPWWPCRVKSRKGKRLCFKFINCINAKSGIWTTLRDNAISYPGERYFHFKNEARNSARHKEILMKAIDLADSFVYDKANGLRPQSANLFSSQENAMSCDETGDLLDTATDEDSVEESVEGVNGDNDDNESSAESENNVNFEIAPFSHETEKLIKQREEWLQKIVDVIKSPDGHEKIRSIIQDPAEHAPLAHEKMFLGEFSFSTTGLDDEVTQYIYQQYKDITSDKYMPAWCFTSLIPRIIVYGMQKVDASDVSTAMQKFLSSTFISVEEEERFDNQFKRYSNKYGV